MRWIAGLFLLLALGATAGYIFLKGYPYRLYSGWVEGRTFNLQYRIEGYRKFLLRPNVLDNPAGYTEDYPQLWKQFPIRNSLIPLPTRHPMFVTVPIVEFKSKTAPPVMGMIFSGPDKREISRVYTLPMRYGQDYTKQQELFKLPFFRNRIMKVSPDQLWKEVFTRNIEVKTKSLDEMVHDLFILHVRSKILPKETVRYGLLKNGKAVIELYSKDKDYMMELILTQQNGSIYSYVLRTAKNEISSMRLRSKFLESIAFSPVDPDMGRILYTEFKTLNFSRQVDQEGLLYLFSAWSQDVDKTELLREMIFYLERGRFNTAQLKALYHYAYRKYGKTFTTRNLLAESTDENLLLQRKIEIEDIERKHTAELEMKKAANIPVPELTGQEKAHDRLRRAKENGAEEPAEVTIH